MELLRWPLLPVVPLRPCFRGLEDAELPDGEAQPLLLIVFG